MCSSLLGSHFSAVDYKNMLLLENDAAGNCGMNLLVGLFLRATAYVL